MSVNANPVTDSSNVNVAVNAPACVPVGPEIVSPGAVRSTSTANVAAAALPLPAASRAASAATATVT